MVEDGPLDPLTFAFSSDLFHGLPPGWSKGPVITDLKEAHSLAFDQLLRRVMPSGSMSSRPAGRPCAKTAVSMRQGRGLKSMPSRSSSNMSRRIWPIGARGSFAMDKAGGGSPARHCLATRDYCAPSQCDRPSTGAGAFAAKLAASSTEPLPV